MVLTIHVLLRYCTSSKNVLGYLKKERRVVNIFDGTKVHTIYKGTITWTINANTGHPYQVQINNSLYVPNGCERLIGPQHLPRNATQVNRDATILNGTWCVTNHDRTTLIWDGSHFVCTMPIDTQKVFTIQTAPKYINFTDYCTAVGYDPFVHDDKPNCVTDKLDFFIRPTVAHSVVPSTPCPYLSTEVETSISYRGL